jgi:hypothetical protein
MTESVSVKTAVDHCLSEGEGMPSKIALHTPSVASEIADRIEILTVNSLGHGRELGMIESSCHNSHTADVYGRAREVFNVDVTCVCRTSVKHGMYLKSDGQYVTIKCQYRMSLVFGIFDGKIHKRKGGGFGRRNAFCGRNERKQRFGKQLKNKKRSRLLKSSSVLDNFYLKSKRIGAGTR